MQTIERLVFLGTDSSPDAAEVLAAWRARTGNNLALSLVYGLAEWELLQRGASKTPVFQGSLPAPAPPSQNPCDEQGRNLLSRLLGAGQIGLLLLPEWLDILAQKNLVLPHESLAILLDYCAKTTTLKQKLQPCLGPRGSWLCQLNKTWQLAYQPQENSQDFDEQLAYLDKLQQEQSDKKSSYLANIWPKLSKIQQLEILHRWEAKVQAQDLSLLSEILPPQAQANTVVLGLRKLQLELSQSPLAQNLRTQFKQILQWREQEWQLNIPPELDLSLWGLSLRQKPLPQEGQQANTLALLGQWIPSQAWLEDNQISSFSDLLQHCWNSPWASSLFWALAKSLTHFPNPQHSLAYHQFAHSKQQVRHFHKIPIEILALPAEYLEEILLPYLPSPQLGFAGEEQNTWNLLLNETKQAWPDKLSQAVQERLITSLDLSKQIVFNYFIISLIKRLALALAPQACAPAYRLWRKEQNRLSFRAGGLDKAIEQLIQTLELRMALAQWLQA